MPRKATSSKKRKRVGGSEPQKKRHRQARRGICELNVDELYIIFTFIYPMDLLNFTRTCKYLRGILMHKSSSFLWKNALYQIEDLPPCPTDLTEPEYTNLVFYSRCHGCGKHASTILWNIRRRYCPACRAERLRSLSSCDGVVARGVPWDSCKIGNNWGYWVDRDQMESFMHEYHQSTDKEWFLNEKRKRCLTISSHAGRCERWQRQNGRVHRYDLEVLRKERGSSIFQRLRQHGYEREIAHFGEETIKQSYKSAFLKNHHSLTDSEWDQMWPDWIRIMEGFQTRRLNGIRLPRRHWLVFEYTEYVTHRPSDAPTFELLPHVTDLARFPPFQEIIKAPEDAPMDRPLFASAFSQLPALVGQWRKQLDLDVAELVKIPSDLSSERVVSTHLACSTATNSELCQMDLDKLRLACAAFHIGCSCLFTYPEVFFTKHHLSYPQYHEDTSTDDVPDQPGIKMLEEAPYIVHACGLDPNFATAKDMDCRNARLSCLCCKGSTLVMDWRSAMLHALYKHYEVASLAPLSESPRWGLISDEHIGAIQAAEEAFKMHNMADYFRRCLLCQPRVGDYLRANEIITHLRMRHGIDMQVLELKRGVHYEHMGILNGYLSQVEMAEEEGKVVFRQPRY